MTAWLDRRAPGRGLTLVLALVLALAGCAGPRDAAPATRDEVDALAAAIAALDPAIDPAEAARAARVAYDRAAELKIRYQITDPPIIHNTKVNLGLRPRGLCWHWAEDMEARLRAEGFRTLQVMRAIAPPRTPFNIDHSTALIGPVGGTIRQAIVLDPWRQGGRLFWAPTLEDRRYDWQPREAVLARRAAAAAPPR